MTPPERPSTTGRRGDPDDGPVLPSVTRDELDEGWGDDRAGNEGSGGERDADWYRRERPPHHG